MVDLSSLTGGAIGGAAINIIIRGVDKFSSEFKKASTSMEKLQKASKAVALGVGAAFAVATKNAAKFEQTTIAFNTLLGSAIKAEKFLKKLTSFAARTPFTLPGVEKSARQLLAVGFEAEEVIPILKNLGDVSSGLGMGEEGLQRLIINLGQVRNQGKLTGRELRDFAVNGVPLLDALAKQLGTTTKGVQELVSQGKVSSEDTIKAFQSLSAEGGKFANLMEKQMGSAIGQISNLQDAISIASRAFGSILLPAIKPVVKAIAEMVNKFNELPEGAKTAISKLAAAGGLAAGGFALFAKLRGSTPATPMFVKEVGVGIGKGGAAAGGLGVGATLKAAGMKVGTTATKFGGRLLGAGFGAATLGIGRAITHPGELGTFETERDRLSKQFPELAKVQIEDIFKKIPEASMFAGFTKGKELSIERQKLAEKLVETLKEQADGEEKLEVKRESAQSVVTRLVDAEVSHSLAMEQLESDFLAGKVTADSYLKKQEELNNSIDTARNSAKLAAPQIDQMSAVISKMVTQLLSDAQKIGVEKTNLERAKQAFEAEVERARRKGLESAASAAGLALDEPVFGRGTLSLREKLSSANPAQREEAARIIQGVGDFIVRPNGEILKTHPNDTLIGIKNFDKGGLGGGINVSIESIQGLDPDMVAEALHDKLRTLISTP